MLANKKRIRSLKSNIGFIPEGKSIIVGIRIGESDKKTLKKLGLPTNYNIGDTVLPASIFGPVSLYNAEGREIVHKDQPMETAYRSAEWHWTEFHGPYDRVEQSKIVDVPYKRYPRSFVSPPAIELTITKTATGESVLVSSVIKYEKRQEANLLHTINLFLEIFGRSEFFTENIDPIIKTSIKRLNWKILPPGKRPWASLKKEVGELIEKAPKGNRPVIEYRLETINKYNPDFTAVGTAGFNGYIILGFVDKGKYILESLYYGNATYVFDKDWENLSKRTKAEILSANLQTDRIIHRESWESNMDKWVN